MRLAVAIRPIPRRARSVRTWVLLMAAAAILGIGRTAVPAPDATRLWGVPLPACPLKTLAGIPCPFCGLTAGTCHALRGELAQAAESNVLSPAFAAACAALGLYALVVRLAGGYAVRLRPDRVLRRTLWVACSSALAAVWVANVYRHVGS